MQRAIPLDIDRRRPRVATTALRPQDLRHGLAFGEFVDELVEAADLPHQRIIDLFDAHAADESIDQRGVRVERGRLRVEGLEIVARGDLLPENDANSPHLADRYFAAQSARRFRASAMSRQSKEPTP